MLGSNARDCRLCKNILMTGKLIRSRKSNDISILKIVKTTMNYEPFIKMVSELVIESEKLWLSVLD